MNVMNFINENKVNMLIGVSVLLLIVIFSLLANGNGNTNPPTDLNTTEGEFSVSNETISNLEGLLEDLIYLNTGTKGDVAYTSGKMDGEYKVLTFVIGGGTVQDIYVSKDEKYLLQAPPISISEMMGEIAIAKVQMDEYLANQTNGAEVETKDLVKTDKPTVELFIMTYCPYGLQAQKALLPAAKLLGDKADIKVRFVSYIMHPTSGETQENLRQHCMQKEGMNYWNYLDCFLIDGNTSKCLVQSEIDSSLLETCYTTEDEKYSVTALLNDKSTWLGGVYPQFNVDKELNTLYGVQGSPTFVINGVVVSAARNPEAFKDAICNAFITMPEECNTELSTTNMPAMFGYEGTGGNTGTC